MYCFADFEFTCGPGITSFKTEILSVGMIITDDNYNIIEKYYNTCKPIQRPKLTNFCLNLTHLQQDLINQSKDSDVICKEMCDILVKYNIKSIYVWGNFDKIGIISDCKIHKSKQYNFENIQKIYKKIQDVQRETSTKFDLKQQLSIANAKEILDIDVSGQLHNALTDAEIFLETYKIAQKYNIENYPKLKNFVIQEKEKIEKLKEKQLKKKKQSVLSNFENKQCKKLEKIDHRLKTTYINIIKYLPSNKKIQQKTNNLIAILPLNNIKKIQIIEYEEDKTDLSKFNPKNHIILPFIKNDISLIKYDLALLYGIRKYNLKIKLSQFALNKKHKIQNYDIKLLEKYFKSNDNIKYQQCERVYKVINNYLNNVYNIKYFNNILILEKTNDYVFIHVKSTQNKNIKYNKDNTLKLELNCFNKKEVFKECAKFINE